MKAVAKERDGFSVMDDTPTQDWVAHRERVYSSMIKTLVKEGKQDHEIFRILGFTDDSDYDWIKEVRP